MNHKVKLGRLKKNVSKALSVVLSAALFVSGLSASFTTTVSAETLDNVVVEGIVDVTDGDTFDTEVVDAEEVAVVTDTDLGYDDFTEDTLVATLNFGSDITASNTFDGTKGFSDVEYNTAAAGWVDGVYYPREISRNEAGATYVSAATDSLAIASKVWTETESTGYGVYTYENTSTYDMVLAPADYRVSVTLVNPTGAAYTASLEAEDITKVSGIEVDAGATVTKDFIAVLVDGTLNLKFLAASTATSTDEAAAQNVYVSKVVITRLATQQPASKPTIFVASDSTVQSYESGEYPKTGWGQTLHLFFGEEVEEREAENAGYSQCQVYEAENVIVENRAIGGRSSSSFVKEGKLDDLLEDIKKGDYLFVQWGHNDATAARPNRYVAPENFEEWIQYYVDGAKQRGAIPVLVTPVARHSFSKGVWNANFEAYGNVMRKMAEEQNLALIDLTARSGALCNSFGEEGAKALFMMFGAGEWPNYSGGSTDQTHLSYYGAYKFAQCVAQGVQESEHADLAALKDKVVVTLPTAVPAQVENLMSTTVGSSSVSMKWDAAEGTELYYIWRAVLEDGQTVEDVVFSDNPTDKYSAAANTAYTDASCEAGVTYVYAVRGFNELGLGEFSEKIVVKTKEAGYKFDINYENSATMEGWTGVNHNQMYDAGVGYGWTVAPGGGRDRNNPANADFNDMSRDFSLGAGQFAVDLPNGDYEITFYAADLLSGTSTIKPSYKAEGLAAGGISCKQSLGSSTSTVRVEDGQLNIEVTGTNLYLNGFTITELQLAPSGFGWSELDLHTDTGAADYLIHFNPVAEAVSYNVYAKNSTDKNFSIVKSFTAEELAASDLDCRAMKGEVGEIYELYITAVVADGSETARSNSVQLVCQYEGDPAEAPKNLVCVSPTEDDTDLMYEIKLAWDPVTIDYTVSGGDLTTYPAIKYVIYRSERAEGEKGFKEFTKVGESKTNSYTDTDVATNINYYYKVKAVTLTGPGEISEVCKTPITGKLVAVNRETYSDRALVAMNLAGADGGETVVTATDKDGNEYTSGVYMSWRSFEADFDENNDLTTAFTVYRDGVAIAENVKVTNIVDPEGSAASVYKVVGSNDEAIGISAKDTAVWANKYLELNLYAPEDETMPDGSTCDYHANDMSVGDLNGDGDLELIVKWYPSNAKDNSGYGYTGKTFLDGYDVDFATGKVSLMWRIDMGINIRSGAHYTQFQVWDFDGDGRAEVAVKTADGTTTYTSTDGTLAGLVETTHVGACNTDALPTNEISGANDYRNENGFILEGPEYFSIFNGEDATKAAADVEYLPERGSVGAWGDAYGNRVDRFLSATAYLNGETPFAVFCRGYYTRTCLTAYGMLDTDADGIGDTIDVYWEYDTDVAGSEYEAQGNHGLSVNDIDNDGKDEIIYGALVVDNDGTTKYSTGLGHGDAMHVSDWVSWNDGLEIMSVHEHDNVNYHVEVRDAETGKILMGYYTGKDTGRGVMADIDPTAEGAEWWSIASPTYEDNDEPAWNSTNGEVYSSWSTLENIIKLADSTPASNASIFWDGDLLSEIQDHDFNEKEGYVPVAVKIYKWNYEDDKAEEILSSTEIWSINGTKGNLGLTADILGDWREEIIARTSTDKNKVRIYSTTIETDYVVPCLLENLAYREGVAWQNVGYNQPANLSYLLSQGTVTSELSEGNVYYNSAEIVFTPANDGDLYGHDIQGYNIYRAEGDGEYELLEYVSNGDLKTTAAEKEPVVPEIIGWKDGKVVGQFDLGNNKNKTQPESFTNPGNALYNSSVGYGFTVAPEDYTNKGTYVALSETPTDLEHACTDVAFAAGTMGFKIDVEEAGKYRVDVYAGSLAGADDTTISVNGTDLGTVPGISATTPAAMLKTAEVELNAGGQILVEANSAKGARALMSAIVVTKLEPVYETIDEDEPKYEIVKETLFEEDFEDGTSAFSLIAAGNTDWEYLEADTSTVNQNTSNYVYGVGSRGGGDTGTQLTTALGITENVKVAFDIKMDACVQNKSSNYALLGAKNASNWLDSSSQILTISGTANGNGYWGTLTVNGEDIFAKANVKSPSESANKGGLLRDSTGWLRVEAELDFENQVMDITIKRISNNSVVYENEALPFVNEVSSLEYIYMAAAKQYGGVFTDNIEIYTETKVPVEEEETETLYVYTDEDLTGNTTYSYKVAAVVNDRAAHMSQPVTVTTAIDIADWKPFDLEPIVEGTPIADGETVASLLPKTHPVIDREGNELESEVTWDVSEVDINTTGTYTIYATFKGQTEKLETTIEVIANEVKGIRALENIKTIVGLMPELPSTVVVEFTNTTTEEKSVTWDTAPLTAILNTVSSCDLVGTVDEYPEHQATVHVDVVANYIVDIPAPYIEVELGEDAAALYPEQIDAVWADGRTIPVDVAWDDVEVDTSTINNGMLDGTVEGWDSKVKLNVIVKNPVAMRFDLGINKSEEHADWIGVTVNPKGGTKTFEELDVHYTEERGYGFLDKNAKCEGRSETWTYAGTLPNTVYKDFAMPDGQTFAVDLPNGKYQVELVAGSATTGTNKVAANIEGQDISISSSGGNYNIGSKDVVVADGQLTIKFTGQLCRTDAIIIRHIPEIALDQSEVTLTKGDNVVLNATVSQGDADHEVIWSSSDEKVVTVSNGDVVAVGGGVATVTVAVPAMGLSAACEVTVKVPAVDVYMAEEAVTLNKGETVNLTATVTPGDATDVLKWSSSNESVATVTADGAVMAVGAGEATITVEIENGETATCKVTVKVPATGIELDQSAVTLDKGETVTLTATITPADTTDGYIWSSSNPAVATVVNGVVTAVGAGEATITVTTTNEMIATCVVTVVVEDDDNDGGNEDGGQETKDGITYEIKGDGVTITDIDKNVAKVVIPDTVTINGKVYKVTSLPKNAFKNSKKLTSITIGNNVTSIGDYAFYGCTKLKTVKIGKNVVTIGKCAFGKSTSLTSITIPDKVKTIGVSAFDGCSKLKTVKLGKSLTAISDKMFYKCKALTKVTIPSKVTKIGKSAFAYCTKLSSVTIGKKVSTIGASAFYKCTALKKVTIPSSVKTIGGSAFAGCTKLATLTIGSKVTTIDKNAFSKCTALKKVTIPASVKTIGANAFYGCKNLKSITIKTTKLTTKSVGSNAFKGINAKATIKVPSKKLADYKTLLLKKGVKKTATIKK